MSEFSIDLFQHACGAAGPLRLEVFGPGGAEPRRLKVPQPFALVGRDPAAEVCLDHPDVSRHHAYLQVIEGRLFCVDLQSRNGLAWGGDRQPFGWLAPGQAVEAGPFQLRLAGPPAGAGAAGDWIPLTRRPPELPPLPEALLEFLNQAAPKPRWRMRGTLALMGSGAGCAVRLVSPTVSRFHAALLRTPAGVWVVDLLSRDGVRVGGSRVRSARLEDGDELRVGNFHLRLRYEAPAEPAAQAPPLPKVEPAPEAVEPPPAEEHPEPEPPARAEARAALPPDPPPAPEYPVARLPVIDPGLLQVAGPGGGPLAVPPGLDQSLVIPLLNQFGQMQQQMFDQFHQTMMMLVQMFGALHREQIGAIREELERVYQITQELQTLQADLAGQPPAPPAAAAVGNGVEPPAPRPEPQPPAGKTSPKPPPRPEPAPPLPGAQPGEDPHAWLNRRIAAIQQERQSRWQKILNFLTGNRPEGNPS